MNLGGLHTRTTVTFMPGLEADRLNLNGQAVGGAGLARAQSILAQVRGLSGRQSFAQVDSENNFPTGAGIASSASGFAALAVAAAAAAGLALPEAALSALARRGSGSACRSVPGGFVEWLPGQDDESSYAIPIADPQHWALVDCVAVISRAHKGLTSQDGHRLAHTSVLQAARVADAPRRLDACRRAIRARDFDALAQVVELDSNLMHAVMLTSTPPIIYWQPATLGVMQAVSAWRAGGLPVCYTIDAGPNVHIITLAEYAAQTAAQLMELPEVSQVLTASVGPATQTIKS